MIDCLVVFGLSLIVRLFPVRNAITDFDTYGHIYYASEVKSQKVGPWGSIRLKCWQTEEFRHPFLWHWLVGFFPKGRVIRYQKWINGALDSVFALAIYVVLDQFVADKPVALLGVLLYLFTPMWFSNLSMGPRVHSFTPRLLSELSINTMLAFTLLDLGFPLSVQMMIAVAFACVALLSSKFGVQALFFLAPLTSLLVLSVKPLLVALGGLFLSAVISRGQLVSILKRQLVHLVEYYQSNKAGKTAISNRNKLFVAYKKSEGSGIDWRSLFNNLLVFNSYTAVVIKMPIYLVVLTLIAIDLTGRNSNYVPHLFAPVLAATIVYLVVNRPMFLFLGEAERYLNHIAVFILITCISLGIKYHSLWVLWALVAYGLCYWLLEVIFVDQHSSREQRKEADKLIEAYLLRGSKSRLVISFPYHNFGLYRIMLCTPHHVIFPYHMRESVRNQFVGHFEYRYPYLNLEKLSEIESVTGVNTLIVDKNAALAEGFGNWSPPANWKIVDLPQSVYNVYER